MASAADTRDHAQLTKITIFLWMDTSGQGRPHRLRHSAVRPSAATRQVFGHEGHGRYEAVLCSLQAGPVPTTTPGFGITVIAGLEAVAAADTVVVPGFRRGPAPADALDALRAAHQRGARIASICSGAFALAQAGLLDGRRATTHWAHAGDLAREHPAVHVDPAVLYVDEGTVLTSAGLAAGLDLCLYLIGLDHGQPAAIQRARRMVTALHRAGGQAQYSLAGATATGERLANVTQWALTNATTPLAYRSAFRRCRALNLRRPGQLAVGGDGNQECVSCGYWECIRRGVGTAGYSVAPTVLGEGYPADVAGEVSVHPLRPHSQA